MKIIITAFSVTFISVFLKGFQHKNVNGNHYKLVAITSYAMAVMDVVLVGIISKNGIAIAIPCGTGAAVGMVLSMYLHNRYVSKTNQLKPRIAMLNYFKKLWAKLMSPEATPTMDVDAFKVKPAPDTDIPKRTPLSPAPRERQEHPERAHLRAVPRPAVNVSPAPQVRPTGGDASAYANFYQKSGEEAARARMAEDRRRYNEEERQRRRRADEEESDRRRRDSDSFSQTALFAAASAPTYSSPAPAYHAPCPSPSPSHHCSPSDSYSSSDSGGGGSWD